MKISSNIMAMAVAAGMCLSLTGCQLYKKFEMPTDSSALAADYAYAKAQPQDSTLLGNLPWTQVFTDPILADLITQALQNNVDYKNAKLNIDIAQANLKGARMAYFPSVALAPSGGTSATSIEGAKNWQWTYNIPLSVSWEVDIFGKLLNSKRSAQAAVVQVEDVAQATRSQIIGAVANCYYAISTLQAQLELQRATAKSWEESVQVMKAMKEAGSTTEAAVVQSEAQLCSILASIKDLETSITTTNTSLSLLVGTMPQDFSIPSGLSLELPGQYQGGIPMSALASRPDVRAQEQALAIAYYATNSARAAFYPSLTISPTGGFTNSLGSMIFNPGKWFLDIAGQLTAPLFSRGQNITRLRAAKIQQEQAMNTFEYTIMKAAGEVRDALATYNNVADKARMLARQTGYMEQAVDITETLFKNSATNYNTTYLEVLTAQQNLLGVQMGYLSSGLTRSQAVINLYQSLGGGR